MNLKFFVISFLFAINQNNYAQVGINTVTPLSTLDINGNLTVKEVGIFNANVAGSGTFFGGPNASPTNINDGIYISMTPTSPNNSFILPNAANFPGRIYILRNISGSNDALLYASGCLFFSKDSKDPSAAPIVMPFNGVLKTIILISDGVNWTYIY